MSQKAIREYDGKRLFFEWIAKMDANASDVDDQCRLVRTPSFSAGGYAEPGSISAAATAASASPSTAKKGKNRKKSADKGVAATAVAAAAAVPTVSEVSLGQLVHLAFPSVERHVAEWNVQEKPDEATMAGRFPWATSRKVVVKPDQLIKRRGKRGLVALNKTLGEAIAWAQEKAAAPLEIDGLPGQFEHFIMEPMISGATAEYYVSVRSTRQGDEVLFCSEGGVDVGDVDEKGTALLLRTHSDVTMQQIIDGLLVPQGLAADAALTRQAAAFVLLLWRFYNDRHFGYLEINPFVVNDAGIQLLDMAAKIDETATFEMREEWGNLLFPRPFSRPLSEEEEYIQTLDARSGSSLKLTLLKPDARIWTMVAGGGASVVYADTIADLGMGHELANYGEYSGAPSETLTYEYAKTLITLMTRKPRPDGKILIVGGGIANFTNVAETFKGILRAFKEFAQQLRSGNVKIYVRRGGPNCEEGLLLMRKAGEELNLQMEVYGPETHMTSIVSMALGLGDGQHKVARSLSKKGKSGKSGKSSKAGKGSKTAKKEGTSSDTKGSSSKKKGSSKKGGRRKKGAAATSSEEVSSSSVESQSQSQAEEQSDISPNDVSRLFTPNTQAVVFGMQTNAVQRMLDFDHICGRKEPSVACMVFPFSGNHFQKFYWGTKEILMPVYESATTAFTQHPQVSVVVSFASCRSVFKSTMDILLMAPPNLRVIAMIAEGVPEKRARQLIRKAQEVNVLLIGPATVGGIFPGAFRIGNAGGALDNVIASKLYRRGSVGYVSRSGGLSNELNNMCARYADGVSCGVAIGGDRFCGSTFIDFVHMYQADPHVKIILVLGEVGGVEERLIGEAMVDGRITKPVIAWCTGTCAKIFTHEVQFGHAGALAQSELQTADSKNAFLRECGALVPMSFDQLPDLLAETYQSMVKAGVIRRFAEPATPVVPMDYNWAAKLGLIRKPTSIVSSITDERGDELMYAGMPISTVFEQDMGIGGVVALLWFRRRLPTYVYKYIEMIIMLVSDHGPAVTSAMATLVTARGGKDLVSSLCAGLLGVGNRFGGAIHDGAKAFYELGQKQGLSPKEFVMHHAKEKKLILGIGHRIKSVENPDKRVELLKAYVAEHFEATPLLDYALEVEKITTQKKSNLILNVDGVIGVTFIDMMQNCGAFTAEEVDEYLDMDCLNALFVTGRTIGLIGHYIDQKRLKQPLYRHDWGDILYATDVKNGM